MQPILDDLQVILRDRLHITPAEVAAFCDRWRIVEFALFGSVLRDDFRSDSDVDVLVVFAPDEWLTLNNWLDMKEELEKKFGRSVDLVIKKNLENPYRRAEILKTHRVIYASK